MSAAPAPRPAAQTVALPRILEIGGGARRRLPAVLERLGCRRPLIVTDTTMVKLGIADGITAILAAAGIAADVHAAPPAEPTAASLQPGLERIRATGCDCLVAVGGGSPIDAAKALAVLAVRGGPVTAFCHPAVVDEPGLPVIAIPTTAGTGSECTRFTIITDDGDPAVARKMLCAGLAFLPVAALVDFELTLGLPPRVTADTGIDALTHAIEAFVSRRAGPYSDHCALGALGLLAPNLRRVFADGADRAAREAVMLGATLAGMAFSNASVALVHGMSRPVGAHFHVPHGLSNAMLLPAVTAFGLEAGRIRYDACARAMGLAGADALAPWLAALNRDLSVPDPRAFGIDGARWSVLAPTMAAQALASGSPGNNPRVPTADEITALYHQVWSQESP
jgi:alcohol dehydrogenase class IV